jgi:voltage-gated potassium channel
MRRFTEVLFNVRLSTHVGIAALLLVSAFAIGVIGFISIEGYTVGEAIYMTVITVSTVGFGEIQPLSEEGRWFTSALIIASLGTVAYSVTVLSNYFFNGEYRSQIRTLRFKRTLQRMEHHVIICGAGRVGEKAIAELIEHHHSVVIIEGDGEKAERLRAAGCLVIHGDATRDEHLIAAGIERAQALLTTLPDDAQNLYVVLSAREQNPNLLIISRASDENAVKKLRVAGARNVIMPDRVGGAHMASLVAIPDVMEFMDHIRIQGSDAVNLEEVAVRSLPDRIKLPTLGELDARNRIGVNVIGIKRAGGDYLINPGPETPLDDACKLFVLGSADQIKKLNRLLGVSTPRH